LEGEKASIVVEDAASMAGAAPSSDGGPAAASEREITQLARALADAVEHDLFAGSDLVSAGCADVDFDAHFGRSAFTSVTNASALRQECSRLEQAKRPVELDARIVAAVVGAQARTEIRPKVGVALAEALGAPRAGPAAAERPAKGAGGVAKRRPLLGFRVVRKPK
jgi:hypothetical protein